jgi:membrane protease YdiL (CAAX protease family)
MGCIYAGFYLLNERNLWLPILVHATANSIGITIAFLG